MAWKRRAFSGRNLSRALNIADLRELAQRRVPGFVFEYVEGGAEDELTLRGNREAFAALRLIPNTLVDTSARHQRIELFGRECSAPLIIAPTAINGLLEPDGDLAVARAAADLGIPFTLSTLSTMRLEDVASKAGGRLWMQLYVTKNRRAAEDIMQRASAAGYEALVFTTDANVFGNREWDRRNYRAPGRPNLRALLEALSHPRWLFEVLVRNGVPRFRNIEEFLPPDKRDAIGGSTVTTQFLQNVPISWEDVAWIRKSWPRKLVIKGVLSVADAEHAAALGCDGIVLTNHGGRQLDSCIAPIDMLPEVAAKVGKRLTILVDSGVRRGTDVVKALALGAHAVMVGRATLYGLAAGGEVGVRRALAMLTEEIDRVLGQLGCCSIAELGPHMVRSANR